MVQEVTAEATVQIPSSQDSPEEKPIPQAETILAAAVETGKAQQAAESAAEEAKEATSKAEAVLTSIQATLATINERLTTVETTVQEELISPEDEEDTQEIAIAETVEIDEPPKQPELTQAKQDEMPQDKQERGGFLRKIFLNR
jgi:hypothetical protein